MEGTEAKHTSYRAATAPASTWCDCHQSGDAVLLIVDKEAQLPRNVIFKKLPDPCLTMDVPFWRANNEIAERQETSCIRGTVRSDFQNMPDLVDSRQGAPLEGETEGW